MSATPMSPTPGAYAHALVALHGTDGMSLRSSAVPTRQVSSPPTPARAPRDPLEGTLVPAQVGAGVHTGALLGSTGLVSSPVSLHPEVTTDTAAPSPTTRGPPSGTGCVVRDFLVRVLLDERLAAAATAGPGPVPALIEDLDSSAVPAAAVVRVAAGCMRDFAGNVEAQLIARFWLRSAVMASFAVAPFTAPPGVRWVPVQDLGPEATVDPASGATEYDTAHPANQLLAAMPAELSLKFAPRPWRVVTTVTALLPAPQLQQARAASQDPHRAEAAQEGVGGAGTVERRMAMHIDSVAALRRGIARALGVTVPPTAAIEYRNTDASAEREGLCGFTPLRHVCELAGRCDLNVDLVNVDPRPAPSGSAVGSEVTTPPVSAAPGTATPLLLSEVTVVRGGRSDSSAARQQRPFEFRLPRRVMTPLHPGPPAAADDVAALFPEGRVLPSGTVSYDTAAALTTPMEALRPLEGDGHAAALPDRQRLPHTISERPETALPVSLVRKDDLLPAATPSGVGRAGLDFVEAAQVEGLSRFPRALASPVLKTPAVHSGLDTTGAAVSGELPPKEEKRALLRVATALVMSDKDRDMFDAGRLVGVTADVVQAFRAGYPRDLPVFFPLSAKDQAVLKGIVRERMRVEIARRADADFSPFLDTDKTRSRMARAMRAAALDVTDTANAPPLFEELAAEHRLPAPSGNVDVVLAAAHLTHGERRMAIAGTTGLDLFATRSAATAVATALGGTGGGSVFHWRLLHGTVSRTQVLEGAASVRDVHLPVLRQLGVCEVTVMSHVAPCTVALEITLRQEPTSGSDRGEWTEALQRGQAYTAVLRVAGDEGEHGLQVRTFTIPDTV